MLQLQVSIVFSPPLLAITALIQFLARLQAPTVLNTLLPLIQSYLMDKCMQHMLIPLIR